ncbi:YCF48-related protein [Pseudomonas kermanshahensis]|uniref:WD40/YVTN/BNR-like repeat-containing protein n=1 Tax=Pseudomonas kermanshahensis TaxID=2745482 RepID=UPI0023DC6549|nr:YCF48-related protein [Pseudomonas kermanshahensis]WEL57704.1 YCF48-related protein [Pseudomonas kermanshahensis]
MATLNTFTPWALAVALTLGGACGGAQAAYIDVLDLPAKTSALVVHSALRDVALAGERLVAVGPRGHIVYSDNQGQDWLQASVPVSADLNALAFPTALEGWAVGNDGVILHSRDGGANWAVQLDGRHIGALVAAHYQALAKAYPKDAQWAQFAAEGQRLEQEGADKPLLGVWFADARHGYAVGVFNLILRTDDGGSTWVPMQDRTDNPQGFHLNAIRAVGDALYLVGEQGLLLKWDAGQQRFVALPSPYPGTWFGVFGKPGEVLAYGLRGHVARSLDGGQSWAKVDTGVTQSITAASLDSHGDYWLFSQGGQVLRSRDGGLSFAVQPQVPPAPVAGALQTGANATVLVGERGVRVLPAR